MAARRHRSFGTCPSATATKLALREHLARDPAERRFSASSGRPTPARRRCSSASTARSTSSPRAQRRRATCWSDGAGRRRRCGNVMTCGAGSAWCFRCPSGLPLSVYDNVAYAPADGRHAAPRRARCAGRKVPAAGGAVGRSQGPDGHAGHEALGRPAAAARRWPARCRCGPRSCASTSSRSPSTR